MYDSRNYLISSRPYVGLFDEHHIAEVIDKLGKLYDSVKATLGNYPAEFVYPIIKNCCIEGTITEVEDYLRLAPFIKKVLDRIILNRNELKW